VNRGLSSESTLSTASRYQPGYSSDGVLQIVEHVQRIGTATEHTTHRPTHVVQTPRRPSCDDHSAFIIKTIRSANIIAMIIICCFVTVTRAMSRIARYIALNHDPPMSYQNV